jgi:ATP adenylyltransferase/5',5'''-P-1,P-4-tetraphosphate phosphorylase II
MTTSLDGDQDLLSSATAQFDHLRKKGQLFWEPSTPEYVEHDGFRFEFRIVPAFTSKPLPKKGSNQPAKGKDPFTDPEDGFVVSYVGETHVLQFNKYAIYRPQLILHTKEFAPQTEDLDLTDFAAGFDVLRQLKEPWVLFYNCGLRAGSSQGHKHMQLIPKPKDEEFVLFPDQMKDVLHENVTSRPPEQLYVPYDCLVAPVSSTASAASIHAKYESMLAKLRKITRVMSGAKVSGAHNMIMTLEWICIIPRQSRGDEGIYTNAMGMMGLVCESICSSG